MASKVPDDLLIFYLALLARAAGAARKLAACSKAAMQAPAPEPEYLDYLSGSSLVYPVVKEPACTGEVPVT
jgi:hypothetical protein